MHIIILALLLISWCSSHLVKRGTFQDYQFIEKLSSGTFGTVYKAIRKDTNKVVAVKSPLLGKLDFEINLLKSLDNENICKLIDFYLNRNGMFDMVIEYYDGGSLGSLIRSERQNKRIVPITIKKRIMKEIANGVEYLHSKNVCHRDIKPDNIMLTRDPFEESEEPLVKIIDFGIADKDITKGTTVGTPLYLAPENIPPVNDNVDCRKTDIFVLGVIFAELVTSVHPFALDETVSIGQLSNRIKSLSINLVPFEFEDELLFDLLLNMLNPDWTQRPDISYVKEMLSLGFIN